MTEEERLHMLKTRLEKRQRQPESDCENRHSTGSTCSNDPSNGVSPVAPSARCTNVKELAVQHVAHNDTNGTSSVTANRANYSHAAIDKCHSVREDNASVSTHHTSYKPEYNEIPHYLTESQIQTIETIVNKFIISSHQLWSSSPAPAAPTRAHYSLDARDDARQLQSNKFTTDHAQFTGARVKRIKSESSPLLTVTTDDTCNVNSSGTARTPQHHQHDNCDDARAKCRDGLFQISSSSPPPPPPPPSSSSVPCHFSLSSSPPTSTASSFTPSVHLQDNVSHCIHVLFTHVQQFINFALSLPFFSSLHSRDQQILLKESVLMMSILRCGVDCRTVDDDEVLWFPRPVFRDIASGEGESNDNNYDTDSECAQHCSKVTLNDICQVFNVDIYHQYTRLVRWIDTLDVDDVTVLLLCLIVLFNCTCDQLSQTSVISQQQEQIIVLLKAYVTWRYGVRKSSHILCKLLLKLSDVRELADVMYTYTIPPSSYATCSPVSQTVHIDQTDGYTLTRETCKTTARSKPMTWFLRTSLPLRALSTVAHSNNSTSSSYSPDEMQTVASSASTNTVTRTDTTTANDMDLDYDSSCPSDVSSSSSTLSTSTVTDSANSTSPT